MHDYLHWDIFVRSHLAGIHWLVVFGAFLGSDHLFRDASAGESSRAPQKPG